MFFCVKTRTATSCLIYRITPPKILPSGSQTFQEQWQEEVIHGLSPAQARQQGGQPNFLAAVERTHRVRFLVEQCSVFRVYPATGLLGEVLKQWVDFCLYVLILYLRF
jgi:hypothetical protein